MHGVAQALSLARVTVLDVTTRVRARPPAPRNTNQAENLFAAATPRPQAPSPGKTKTVPAEQNSSRRLWFAKR